MISGFKQRLSQTNIESDDENERLVILLNGMVYACVFNSESYADMTISAGPNESRTLLEGVVKMENHHIGSSLLCNELHKYQF